ncbi:hypothetical protein BGX26_010272 [Mortierella sp. AD094]|nr:hypothetical protein BGX26_010272 [Mortierella sp. AD094]
MYAVAGEAAANVAGVSYEKLVKDKVLDPLGLTNTGFSPMEMKQRPNYAMPYDAASLEDAKKGLYELGYLDEVYMADAPAGDIYSNVLDLARWGRVIMKHGELDGKQVLNKESVQETLCGYTILSRKRSTSEFSPSPACGLGWCLDSYKGQVVYSHGGLNPGYRSGLTLVPDSDLFVACLANINVAELISHIPHYVMDEILGLPKTQDWITEAAPKSCLRLYDFFAKEARGNIPERVENKPPAHGLGAFVGNYSHPVYGNISIRLEKNKKDDTEDEEESLLFKMRTFNSKMEHYHFDSFKTFLHDFVIKSTILVNFQTGQDGKVATFKVDAFVHGPLEFKKNIKE